MYHKKADILNCTWFKYFMQKLEANCTPIILTWKNNTSNLYNSTIRQYIHGEHTSNNYLPGDYVIFTNFYQSPLDSEKYHTSNIIKIIEVNITDNENKFNWLSLMIDNPKSKIDRYKNILFKTLAKIKQKFKIDKLTIQRIVSHTDNMNNVESYKIITVNRNYIKKYKSMLKDYHENLEVFFKKYNNEQESAKLWSIYHVHFIDPYADINFGYSITTHKAQGSTFNIVIVDMEDICCNPDVHEMQKALYTATTRAADELRFLMP